MDYDVVRENLNMILTKSVVELTTDGKKQFIEAEFDNNQQIRDFEKKNNLRKWVDLTPAEQRQVVEFLRPHAESYDGEQQIVVDLILQCMEAPGYDKNQQKVSQVNEGGVYYIERQRVLHGNDYAKSFEELDKITAQ